MLSLRRRDIVCLQAVEMVTDYLEGSLSRRSRRRFEAHLRACPNCAAYLASKFGALGLTRVLREELRSRGIRVTAILPGSTDTRLIKAFGFPVDRSKLLQPRDVAAAVLGALLQPPRAAVEEIVLLPAAGRL